MENTRQQFRILDALENNPDYRDSGITLEKRIQDKQAEYGNILSLHLSSQADKLMGMNQRFFQRHLPHSAIRLHHLNPWLIRQIEFPFIQDESPLFEYSSPVSL